MPSGFGGLVEGTVGGTTGLPDVAGLTTPAPTGGRGQPKGGHSLGMKPPRGGINAGAGGHHGGQTPPGVDGMGLTQLHEVGREAARLGWSCVSSPYCGGP